MKTLYITLTTLLITTQAMSAVDLKKQDVKLASVLTMEQKQDYFGAVLTSAQASAEILNQIHVDEIVKTIDTKMTEIRNEVVTHKYNTAGNFSFLLGMVSANAQAKWDSATIVTTNPEEVDGFSRKISSDFRSVQSDLKLFVKANEIALAYAKAFALKTVQLGTKLSATDRKNLLPLIKSSVQFSQQLRFLGAQNILKCIETNYADRARSGSANINLLFMSFSLAADDSQLAHTTKNCSGSTQMAEVSDSILISAKLSKLDTLINSYQKELGLLEVAESKAEAYPTWGSPHYK